MRFNLKTSFLTTLCTTALVCIAATSFAGVNPPCINGEYTINVGDPITICGAAGAQYTYSWHDSSGAVLLTEDGSNGRTQCHTFGPYAVPGDHNFLFTISDGPLFSKCPFVIHVVAPEVPLVCPRDTTICNGTTVQLCGQEGDFTYTWDATAAGGGVTHDRCVTVGPFNPGSYVLHYIISHGAQFLKCDVTVHVNDCVTNCPRTVGFWGQQCDQKANGSTKFTVAQVTSIASGVDALSSYFNFGGTPFASFCAIINAPKPMTLLEQTKRQFAGLLANVVTGNLGLIANNGDKITLDVNTAFTCAGNPGIHTIGDLIAAVNAALIGGGDLSTLETCLDNVNNGLGIGAVCPQGDEKDGAQESSFTGEGVDLVRATPNPFVASTRLSYSIKTSGEQVDLGVFDVSGRQVRGLVNAFQTTGTYSINWDGRDNAGSHVKAGVYFLHGSIGNRTVGSRVLYMQ